MSLARDISSTKFRASVKVGVSRAVVGEEAVTGYFKDQLAELTPAEATKMLEELANSDIDCWSVGRFMEKYGPLDVAPKAKSRFRTETKRFGQHRDELRRMWKFPEQHRDVDLKRSGDMRFRAGSVTYYPKDLYSYATFIFAATEVDRIRVCGWEACTHPYFIAAHLKKKFCSAECAEQGRLKTKRDWWERHGTAWRAGRPSGGESGT